MSAQVSVIVPVYNAGEYLRPCLDSLSAQTLDRMEFVLVDDGSRDGSGGICDEYAGKDDRFTVIHKENAGVSAARNTGIAAARGEYIGFADADDWVEPEMFAALLEQAHQTGAEVVMCDAVTVYSNGRKAADTITQLPKSTILTHNAMTPPILLELAGSAWRCLYSAKLLKSRGLEFPLGVKFSEDRVFNLYAMGYANKVCYIKRAYYNRFVNCQSAVHRFHADYFEAYKKAAQRTKEAIKAAWGDDETYQTAYLSQFVTGAFGAINNYYYKTSTFSARERKAAVKALCEDKDLRTAIQKSGCTDRRGRWILNQNAAFLTAYAKLANFKHGR